MEESESKIKSCPGCPYLDQTNPECMEDPSRPCFMWAEKPKAPKEPVYDFPVLQLRFVTKPDQALFKKLSKLSAGDGHELADDILCILHDFAGRRLRKRK